MEISFYSYAYHKVLQQFVYVIGMKDMKANFNPNGNLFTVRVYRAGEFIAKRSELVPVSAMQGVQCPDTGRLVHIGHFSSDSHRKFSPVAVMPIPVLKFNPGDHVALTEHTGYQARVVSGKVNQYLQGEYVVAYYQSKNIVDPVRFRVSRDSTTTIMETQLALLPTPAPRIALDSAKTRRVQERAKHNLALNVYKKHWRYGYNTTATSIKAAIKRGKDNGSIISTVMAQAYNGDTDYISDNLRGVFQALTTINNGMAILQKMIDADSGVSDFLTVCNHCSSIEYTDELRYSSDSDTSFCSSCSDSFVYSSCMGDDIHVNNYINVFDSAEAYFDGNSDDVATQRWVEITSCDYVMYRSSAVNSDVYDEIEANDPEGGTGLSGYHDADRNWREVWADKSYVPLGVELEVYAEPRRAAVMAVAKACKGEVYLERDGSLDRDYGFEVITQPFGKIEWATFGHKLLNTLKEKHAVAWSEPAGKGYGIHVNINRKYLSALQEARMFMFLVAKENCDFNRAIAQRSKIYNADVLMGESSKQYQKINRMGGLQRSYVGQDSKGNDKYRRTMVGRGKYAPIRLHDDRMEIRVFQSTLNTLSFYKNLEFTWALVEWTSTKAATGTSWLHVDFLKWLVARPHAEKDYPNLLAYLRKKSFTLSDGDEDEYPEEVDSTWADLIPKPNRSSIAVEVIRKTHDEVTQFVVPVAKVYDYAIAA